MPAILYYLKVWWRIRYSFFIIIFPLHHHIGDYKSVVAPDLDEKKDPREYMLFLRRVWALAMAYKTLGSPGMQRALPHHCFLLLKKFFGVNIELCASALNRNRLLPRYFSAFLHVEVYFGSEGGCFGATFPKGGNAQFNCPFISEFSQAAILHYEAELASCESQGLSLLFVFILPYEEHSLQTRMLEDSRFRANSMTLPANCHSYYSGKKK